MNPRPFALSAVTQTSRLARQYLPRAPFQGSLPAERACLPRPSTDAGSWILGGLGLSDVEPMSACAARTAKIQSRITDYRQF